MRALGTSSRAGQADKDVADSARAGASGWNGSRATSPISRSLTGAQVVPHSVADSAHAEHSDSALSERPFRVSCGIQSRIKGHNIIAPHHHLCNARVDRGSKHSPTGSELRKMDIPPALQECGSLGHYETGASNIREASRALRHQGLCGQEAASKATGRQWSAQCSSHLPLHRNVACRTNTSPLGRLMPKQDRVVPITLSSHSPLGKDLKSSQTCQVPSTCIRPELGRGSAPSFIVPRAIHPRGVRAAASHAVDGGQSKVGATTSIEPDRATGQEPTGYIAQARAEAWAKAKARAKAAAAKPKAAAGTSSRSWPPEPPAPARRQRDWDYDDDHDRRWQDWSQWNEWQSWTSSRQATWSRQEEVCTYRRATHGSPASTPAKQVRTSASSS